MAIQVSGFSRWFRIYPLRNRRLCSFEGAKAAIIYRAASNIRAIKILIGHMRIENSVRYLGVDVEDALLLAKRTEI